ncbi:hypothetical protein B1R38_06045 [Bacillus cereus]|uniref:hypothetical protein n=1 Tax=Bacillus cereus group TaxID=86661 RepID=UPI000BFC6B40|nr:MULTISPECIES: hypothetical protein [Bacillus cereus group]PGP49024.1 hypothetical protein CN993_00700 [Bacillus thuringiensis]PWE74344.1 hypothetical protein B1R38_06045 [Bacillus cereus]
MNIIYALIKVGKTIGYGILAFWLGMQWLGPDGFAKIVNVTINEGGRAYFNLEIPQYVLITTFVLAVLECFSNMLPNQ